MAEIKIERLTLKESSKILAGTQGPGGTTNFTTIDTCVCCCFPGGTVACAINDVCFCTAPEG